MKRLLALSLLLFPITLLASDWTIVAPPLYKSIVYVENAGGACTGFVIDKERGFIMTAAHCDGDKLYADNSPAKIVAKDAKKDLMVIVIEGLDRPALRLATDNPVLGEEVASYGYGYALERPMFRIAHVADDRTYIAEDGIGGPLFVLDSVFVGGQSGGPVVNFKGEVVMIVQRASNTVGLGVGAETIKDKMGKYFAKSRP